MKCEININEKRTQKLENTFVRDMIVFLMREHKRSCKGDCAINFLFLIDNLEKKGYIFGEELRKELI